MFLPLQSVFKAVWGGKIKFGMGVPRLALP